MAVSASAQSSAMEWTTRIAIVAVFIGLGSAELDGPHDDCLRCLCEVLTSCDVTKKCTETGTSKVCGLLGITEPYWQDGARPLLERDHEDNVGAFQRCVRDPFCAEKTVRNYYNRYKVNCEGDDYCRNLARLHFSGPPCSEEGRVQIVVECYRRRVHEAGREEAEHGHSYPGHEEPGTGNGGHGDPVSGGTEDVVRDDRDLGLRGPGARDGGREYQGSNRQIPGIGVGGDYDRRNPGPQNPATRDGDRSVQPNVDHTRRDGPRLDSGATVNRSYRPSNDPTRDSGRRPVQQQTPSHRS